MARCTAGVMASSSFAPIIKMTRLQASTWVGGEFVTLTPGVSLPWRVLPKARVHVAASIDQEIFRRFADAIGLALQRHIVYSL